VKNKHSELKLTNESQNRQSFIANINFFIYKHRQRQKSSNYILSRTFCCIQWMWYSCHISLKISISQVLLKIS